VGQFLLGSTCVADCGAAMLKDLKKKICLPIGNCTIENRVAIEDECLCAAGEFLQTDGLTCATTCSSANNELIDLFTRKCITDTDCLNSNRFTQNGECRCAQGLYEKNSQCVVECGAGMLEDLITKRCVTAVECGAR
jgi:hypothetical protein